MAPLFSTLYPCTGALSNVQWRLLQLLAVRCHSVFKPPTPEHNLIPCYHCSIGAVAGFAFGPFPPTFMSSTLPATEVTPIYWAHWGCHLSCGSLKPGDAQWCHVLDLPCCLRAPVTDLKHRGRSPVGDSQSDERQPEPLSNRQLPFLSNELITSLLHSDS